MRFWGLLLSLSLAGCGHSRARVQREEGADFSHLRRFGVPAFTDPRGQGALIADRVSDALQKKMYDVVDRKTLEEILAKYKPNSRLGLGAEALQSIQTQTSADAIVFGRMAGDGSGAVITIVEMEMGQPVARAFIVPRKKTFADPEEIASEIARVIAGLR